MAKRKSKVNSVKSAAIKEPLTLLNLITEKREGIENGNEF